ncbi:regulator of G-protein signaling 22 isoform X16 [Canis lupus dingo]|uniref:regulator of G-protein signaling 22 isoform X15 n=1 Tax=Canis lupus familiaris TaxID=9615 RepID=UPI000BAA1D25|nr:regulator of G-protein signaling 22 isoform X15 [Canis lupus familiaris]XP_048949068.1 regulator of G-protein signaling 22 isoform X16 [Canis lupus dingo]|eukprot:XP_022282287.1 regulator of G-protein signaling 22 isoform X17 [Canis lupus familiaris]
MAGKLLAAEPPDITEEGFGFRIYLYVSSPELCIRWVIGHLHHLDAPASPPQSHSTLCFFQECDQEDSLATDDFLVDYFNEFLSLPTFSEAVRFNVDYGVFEIVNNAPQLLEKQLKKILRNQQPRNPIYDVVRKGKNDIKPVQMNAPYEDEAINVNYNIMCLSREEGIEWIKKERLPAFLESDCYFEYRLAKLVSQVRWSGSGMNITVNTEFSPWVLRKPPSPPPPVVEEDNVIIMKKFYISLGEGSYTQTKDWFALAKQSLQTVPTFSLPSCVLHSKPEPPVVSSISESFIFDDRIHPRTKRDSSETIRLTSHFEEEEDGAPRFCVTHSSSAKHASAELKFWHLRQEKPRKDVDPFPQMATLLPLRPKSCIPQISDMQKEESNLLQCPKSPKKPPRVKTAGQKPWKSKSLYLISSKDDAIEKGLRHRSESNKVIRLTSFTDISECLKPQLDRRYTYTEEPSVKTMTDGALGGFDMENLLQSLYVENRAGFFFTKFCEHSGNKLWKNSVYFWFDLQAYHQLFYQETLHPFKVCKQAQYLFATYIAPSATLDIGLQQEKKKEIYMKIQPPFEDLFDTAEEYILLLLLEPWTKMVKLDQVAFGKVELVEDTRQLDSTYFRKLQALHKETFSKKAEDTTCEIGTGISRLPEVSKKTEYWSNVPEEYRHFNFNDLLNNKLEFEHFRQFLEAHSSSLDLMCWTDIEQFRRIIYGDRKQREAKSIYIKNKYLNKKYFFGPQSPASQYQQDQIMNLSGGWGQMLHEQLDAPVLIEVQKHVLNKLENVWLPLFLASEQFVARQKIKIQMRDIAEELLLQKHERKIGVWKPVESKWISSSCEIIAFRKALLNPVTVRQFQRFVALKGDLLENDVLFWQEVQKYKDLCHSHCEESIIHKKIMTIINCFINSSIPPALQIDIPVEQAQKIIEHRKELGPYVFREAQMTIFGVLFKFWPQFCEFRKNLTDEKIMSVLERRQEYNKQKKKLAVIEDENFAKDGIKQYPSSSGSAIKTAALATDPVLGLQAYGRQPTWCYSKYIEALEQERILLKIQEELEKKLFTATPSFTNFKSTASTMSLKKTVSSHNIQSWITVVVLADNIPPQRWDTS